MKHFPLFLTAALAAVMGLDVGQAQQGQPYLRVKASSSDLPRGGIIDIYVVGGNRNAILYKMNQVQVDAQQLPYSRFTTFYMMEPGEYLQAQELMQNNKMREARASFAAFKAKYKALAAVPDNYVQRAAFHELECAVALADWNAVADLYKNFPKQVALPADIDASLDALAPMAKIGVKDWKGIVADTDKLLKVKSRWSLKDLARISYARGLAQAGLGKNEEALQELAMAVVCEHGAYSPLSSDAILRSVDLLGKDPQVVKYMKENPKAGAKMPQALKDAAAYVFLHKNILFPSIKVDDKYEAFMKYYVVPERKAGPKPTTTKPTTNGSGPILKK